MGTLQCFSAASILRCESFTGRQYLFLLIPTALELLFATVALVATLVSSRQSSSGTTTGRRWRNVLLSAEGWSYFGLALLEVLAHNIPAVRDSRSVFSVVDIVLGATSFLPILFYTLFVYFFTRSELIDTLPLRFQRIAGALLIIFIPGIIALNELASFIGIHRRTLISNGRPVLAIGYDTFTSQQLGTFLTSLTLAFLTAYEAITFCFSFYRLIRAFVDQRRIETTSSDAAHPIRGIGWISAGFKLGAIETVIGFAEGGFGGALTRRVLRFLSRASLVVGVLKGVDEVDDFTELTREMEDARRRKRGTRAGNAFRRSIGILISNPRLSTFRQLSPTANEFYREKGTSPVAGPSQNQMDMGEFTEIRRAALISQPPSPLYTLSGPMSPFRQQQQQPSSSSRPPMRGRSQTLTSLASTYTAGGTKGQRVTVHFPDPEKAPKLEMRFSGLEMPSPAVIAESIKGRPVSAAWVSIARSSRYAPSVVPSFAFDAPMTARDAPPVPSANLNYPESAYSYNAPSVPVPAPAFKTTPRDNLKGKERPQPTERVMSQLSTRSENLTAVRELAAQFPVPGIPPTQLPAPRAGGEMTPVYESPSRYNANANNSPSYPYNNANAYPASPSYNATSYPASTYTQSQAQPTIQTQYSFPTSEEPDEEPVFQYAYDGDGYDGPATTTIPHPYANAAAFAPAHTSLDMARSPYSPPRLNDAYSPPHSGEVYSPLPASRMDTNSYAQNSYMQNAGLVYSPPQPQQRTRTAHRNMRSDTTLGTTPRTYASSPFDGNGLVYAESRATTPNSESDPDSQSRSRSGSDPFQFDAMSGKTRIRERYAASNAEYEYGRERNSYFPPEMQEVPEEVSEDDGPHSFSYASYPSLSDNSQSYEQGQKGHAVNASRSSAALLQMTQREPGTQWAPAGVEFTPSVFSASSTTTPRNTLKKKRSTGNSKGASPDTLASSWLHGPLSPSHEESMADVPVPVVGRVKSVGRVKAPTKPVASATRHARTRGSMSAVAGMTITVPPVGYSGEVELVQGSGSGSADSWRGEFGEAR